MTKTPTTILTTLAALALPALPGCGVPFNPVSGMGTLVFDEDLEGGCFILERNDGMSYEPRNIPADLEQDARTGLEIPVSFSGLRTDDASICQVGPVISLLTITELEE